MTYSFHPEAEEEFVQAIDYYEAAEPGLGYDFAIEVFSSVQLILSYPQAWPVLAGEIRRCLVRRFPFGVLYAVGKNEVLILAVMHLHREPDYWKNRTAK
jgi:plasmid stabilization system protein ParE